MKIFLSSNTICANNSAIATAFHTESAFVLTLSKLILHPGSYQISGPQNIHPSTTYDNLRNTKPRYSSTPWTENQSLYWHPSIYRVTQTNNGQSTYTRVNDLESSPYYRWNTSTSPETVEFPPGFRMITYSNQAGGDLFMECCDYTSDGEEDCTFFEGNPLVFPTTTCEFLGIAMGKLVSELNVEMMHSVLVFQHIYTDGVSSSFLACHVNICVFFSYNCLVADNLIYPFSYANLLG